jgi:hypothetical protein
VVALSSLALLVGACADSGTSPADAALASRDRAPSTLEAEAAAGADNATRVVRIRDECDPTTFNAAFNDPNICKRSGNITFDHFLAELTKTQQAPQWQFDANEIELDGAGSVLAINRGGEVHTFTRVAKFAGGIIPLLNDLTGNADVAPECTTLEADDFVAPGATYTAELNTDVIQHFQCCIHPWMRADVRLKLHS